MPKTIIRKNETLEEALRRFKRDVSRAGNLAQARKKEYYEKPSAQKNSKKYNK